MSGVYSIEDHRHRFSAWAAARGAATSKLCRFKVAQGVAILEHCGFDASFSVGDLPSPADFDAVHARWREKAINHAKFLNFTHGVAAKLINLYLKSRMVCGGYHNDARVRAVHPPIDAVLLQSLADHDVGGKRKEWIAFKKKAWSNYGSATYEEVIDLIKEVLDDQPLWMIEKYWRGYQSKEKLINRV